MGVFLVDLGMMGTQDGTVVEPVEAVGDNVDEAEMQELLGEIPESRDNWDAVLLGEAPVVLCWDCTRSSGRGFFLGRPRFFLGGKPMVPPKVEAFCI